MIGQKLLSHMEITMESKETALFSQSDLASNSGESYILSMGFILLTYEIGTNNIYLVANRFKI